MTAAEHPAATAFVVMAALYTLFMAALLRIATIKTRTTTEPGRRCPNNNPEQPNTMTKKTKEVAQDEPEFTSAQGDGGNNPAEDTTGGRLPGEEDPETEPVFGDDVSDESTFVSLKEPGETFTGMFIRKVEKGGSEDLKYPGLLFAEYPIGSLRVVPANWSVGEMIAKAEEHGVIVPGYEGAQPIEEVLIRMTVNERKTRKDDTEVKLFTFNFAHAPKTFRQKIRWTEQFQQTAAKPGK